jgi:type IV pilus modification protein PilV
MKSGLYRQFSPRATGFSLIEVLVAIVVLSFGMLGMVGLQAASPQTNRDARMQSTAVVLAREMAEMMRGNKEVSLAANNAYLVAKVERPLVSATPTYCLSVGSACDAATSTALAEVTDWLARVDSIHRATYSSTAAAIFQSVTLRIQRIDVSSAEQPNRTRIVIISKPGRVRACNPSSDTTCTTNATE